MVKRKKTHSVKKKASLKKEDRLSEFRLAESGFDEDEITSVKNISDIHEEQEDLDSPVSFPKLELQSKQVDQKRVTTREYKKEQKLLKKKVSVVEVVEDDFDDIDSDLYPDHSDYDDFDDDFDDDFEKDPEDDLGDLDFLGESSQQSENHRESMSGFDDRDDADWENGSDSVSSKQFRADNRNTMPALTKRAAANKTENTPLARKPVTDCHLSSEEEDFDVEEKTLIGSPKTVEGGLKSTPKNEFMETGEVDQEDLDFFSSNEVEEKESRQFIGFGSEEDDVEEKTVVKLAGMSSSVITSSGSPPLRSAHKEEIIDSIEDAERTMMIDDPFSAVKKGVFEEEEWRDESAVGYPKIVIIGGDDYGREFSLNAPRMKVGRFDDSDVCIRDDSVSRNHAEIIREDDHYILSDLGSLNGTKVNNREITEHTFQPNDQVKFGDILCTYIAPGDIFTLDARESTQIIDEYYQTSTLSGVSPIWTTSIILKLKRLPLGLIAGAVAIILILVVVLWPNSQKQSLQQQQSGQPRRSLKRVSVPKLMEEGFRLYQEQAWKDAKYKFEEVLKINPMHSKATEYLLYIDNEILNGKYIETAQYMMKEEEWQTAISELRKVSNKSKSYPLAIQYLKQSEMYIINLKLAKADKLYSHGNYAVAQQMYEEVLKVDSGNDRAKKYLNKSHEKIAEAEKKEKQKQKQEKRRRKKRKKRVYQRSQKQTPQSLAFEEAFGLYLQGKSYDAIAEFLKVYEIHKTDNIGIKASGYAKAIRTVLALHKKAEGYYSKQQFEPAIEYWEECLKLDRKFKGHKSGHFYKLIGEKLSESCYQFGEKSYQIGKYSDAREYWQKSIKLNSREESVSGMERLKRKAKQLWQEAYFLQETNPGAASMKWNMIVKIVPASNEYYKKAQNKLDNY